MVNWNLQYNGDRNGTKGKNRQMDLELKHELLRKQAVRDFKKLLIYFGKAGDFADE